ncbi:hypothetical protein HELRODRAFT_172958 [Helobdella robusta]|uniref:Uncharacterized protein n=1 Tax=Helobdella robusta TaxID=6412 RepID=T1F674_HELRO|nr:hypothetical protein HELRODRAFT_172958 [Helobdella robusta]ESO03928.1 hypothetical protein HELRODRAFT_172958 [Helobdella robusta]
MTLFGSPNIPYFASTADANYGTDVNNIVCEKIWFSRIGTTLQDVLKQFGYEKRKLLQIIRRGQLKFFGHIMRKERMENLTTTGKIAGKKDRGQQQITFVKFLCHLLNITTFQLLQFCIRNKFCVFRSLILSRINNKQS